MRELGLSLSLTFAFLSGAALAEPLVATTDPLEPAEEQQKLKLPPGFAIELVAAEPVIHKPMNMKFDARGRLWVTHSVEYPFAAADPSQARDAITVLSDFGPDGRARRAERFAEHLNIPIGVLPLSDREALCWSIPNIWRLIDRDGDGAAEERSVVFGPFGVTDTHGDQNAFTRWVDGWVYANHGFSNYSRVKIGGEGPVAIEMRSGNTYRFRADGSAIEQYSWGQVNPFGLAFDPLGNLFSADCHSRAVSMLLREGYYQSFGKPHDGLGFAPDTTTIDHGGTGIAAVAYLAARYYPAEYRDALLIGNVITNRVHCDRLQWTGSSPRVTKVEDFVRSEDPWFRPVDVQLGPDGAVYIADFYNRIIGHYEVPLKHPGRDRERGRIWRVVYRGAEQSSPGGGPVMPNLAEESDSRLVERLGDRNLAVRVLATNLLVDRASPRKAGAANGDPSKDGPSKADQDRIRALLASPPGAAEDPAAWRAHALWVMNRLGGLDESLARRLADDAEPMVRAHLVQALAAQPQWQPWHFEITRGKLADSDPFTRRAAATALAQHPSADNIRLLARALLTAPADDPQLVHATKIALRDQLRSPLVGDTLAQLELPPEERKQVLAIAALSPGGPAAMLICQAALAGAIEPELLIRAAPHAGRVMEPSRIDALVDNSFEKHAMGPSLQLALLEGLGEGLAGRGQPPTDDMRRRMTALLEPIFDSRAAPAWVNYPAPDSAPSANPWVFEGRRYADGTDQPPLVSSLREPGAAGERLTGVLRSREFILPARLSFWMCGHDGRPKRPRENRNYVRLVLAGGEEVARSPAPRDDVARRFEWNLAGHEGKSGHIELVDGLSANAYAWLAAARFEPPVVPGPTAPIGDRAGGQAQACRLAAQWRIDSLAEPILRLSLDQRADADARLAAGEALLALAPDKAAAPLRVLMTDGAQPVATRQRAAELLGRANRDDARAALADHLAAAPQPLAASIAAALAGHKESAARLVDAIRAGKASAALLREPTVVARLRTSGVADLDAAIAELTARLSPADDRISELINQRRRRFLDGHFDPQTGRSVFARGVCKNCHKIGDVGSAIAPALDGIGVRGLDRLLEDLLDPNRNVDQAFRVTTIETEDGLALAGFGLHEDGQSLTLFDSAGQSHRVPLAAIADRQVSPLSPMPANVAETMSEEDFCQLLAYLLSQKAK